MQAARGTPLKAAGRLALWLALAIVMIDQASKAVALSALGHGERVVLVPGVIDLRLFHNAGAAFGAGAGYTVILSLLAIAVAIAVVRLAGRLADRRWAVALGLLLGGASGNLIDRLVREPGVLRGRVVDFIDYGIFIGNIADIALTCAAAVIVWLSWRGIPTDGTRT